jgi:cell division septation protein DedD
MRIRMAIAMATAVLATADAGAAPTVKAGVEAWQKGDHAGAVAIWRNLAERGDADAAFNLGQAFRLGRGVPADSGQATRWFEAAANKGHVDAQVSLGLLLFDSGERGAAMSWLRKAAAKGEPRALLVVGTALFNGDGMKQDRVLGYAYVSRAAAQGLAPAQSTLADMDSLLPLEDRLKGVAIALAASKDATPAASTKPVVKIAPPPAAKPASKSAPNAPAVDTVSGTAKAAASARGVWRVQLGAFSARGTAEGLYRKLSNTPALAGRQPYYIPVGSVTRLQAGPFDSRASAAAACARLAPQPCFPVEAR